MKHAISLRAIGLLVSEAPQANVRRIKAAIGNLA